jgi:hypothetical protein
MKKLLRALSYVLPIAALSYVAWDLYTIACEYLAEAEDVTEQYNALVDMVEAGDDIIVLRLSDDDVPDPNLTLDNYLYKEG